MNKDTRKKWRHDIRSSLNGVICMGSLLEETDLTEEQRELVQYILSSGYKAVELLDQDREDENSLNSTHNESSQRGEGRSILVAEDDDINRLFLTTLLKRKGWLFDEASDGNLAVKLCRDNPYSMILMNVSLPGLDGFQASRKIRENGITTPIIAITAHSPEDLTERIREAGIDEVLRKPFTEEQLIEILTKLISPSV